VEPVSTRAVLRVDVSDVAPPGCKELALEVIPPRGSEGGSPRAVLVCFPGGGMTRRYFDLAAAGYSFAGYASARGFLVVLVDHPGTGDSDAPDDGWTLTPTAVAGIEAAAVHRVLALLSPSAPVIGVGHSMGAHLLIHQAALSSGGAPPDPPTRAPRPPSGRVRFDGLALLGWCGRGLPQYLDAGDLTLGQLDATDPEAFTAQLVASARRRFPDPLSLGRGGGAQLLIKNPMTAGVRQALLDVRAPLLAACGHASMIPGAARRAAAAIDVPVFLGVGEHDIATDHRLIPGEFPSCGDITLYVLPGAGHNHNVEPGREQLWERVTSWADQLGSRR
jgi:alpha-beta hydrolase superfamily lysophospholipase